jgi:hypothetical protein
MHDGRTGWRTAALAVGTVAAVATLVAVAAGPVHGMAGARALASEPAPLPGLVGSAVPQ